MKKIICIFMILSSLIYADNKTKLTHTMDKSHTSVDFKVTHLVISKVTGVFKNFESEINWNPKQLNESYLKGTVYINSIDTNNKKRDQHLNSDDFFDSKQFPVMILETTNIKQTKKAGIYDVEANFTMKDVTKKINFELETKGPITDYYGNVKTAFSSSFSINRFDYNLKWNAALETGELVVGKDVVINIDLQANKIN